MTRLPPRSGHWHRTPAIQLPGCSITRHRRRQKMTRSKRWRDSTQPARPRSPPTNSNAHSISSEQRVAGQVRPAGREGPWSAGSTGPSADSRRDRPACRGECLERHPAAREGRRLSSPRWRLARDLQAPRPRAHDLDCSGPSPGSCLRSVAADLLDGCGRRASRPPGFAIRDPRARPSRDRDPSGSSSLSKRGQGIAYGSDPAADKFMAVAGTELRRRLLAAPWG